MSVYRNKYKCLTFNVMFFVYNGVVPNKIRMGCNVRKLTFGHVRPAKIQMSLLIRTVRSESSLGAFWMAKDAKFLLADNED